MNTPQERKVNTMYQDNMCPTPVLPGELEDIDELDRLQRDDQQQRDEQEMGKSLP